MEISIRPLRNEDALVSWKWRNDPEVWKFTGKRPDKPITPDIELNWIKEVLNKENEKRFAICINETDQYIGNVQLTSINGYDAEFHIFIGEKAFWGKGIAQRATALLTAHAFDKLHLQSVHLDVKKENIAAIKAYQKAGYQEIFQYNEYIRMAVFASDSVEKKVSVFMMTYNHEKFIEEALNGILKQEVDFSYDIVLGDDFSADRTRKIILDYAIKNPGKFKLLYYPKNITANYNQLWVLKNCKGKYVAMCEGDDYWTDPLKLQKQINFLDENSEYVLSFHKVKVLKPNGELVDDFITKVPENFETQETLARLGNYIHTPSVVFRNIIKEFPGELTLSPIGDYFLYLLLTSHGKIHCLNEEMAVYRYGVGVITRKKYLNTSYMLLKLYACVLSSIDNEEIKKIIINRFLSLADETQKINVSELENNNLAISKSLRDLNVIYLLKTKAFFKRLFRTFLNKGD